MFWEQRKRTDQECRVLADRHYSRQKPGTPSFVAPGRCLVLYHESELGKALWVTSYPFAQYVLHRWAGAWTCALFRNESKILASELIHQAVQCTRAYYGEPPDGGFITFVKPDKIRSTNPGYCYKMAGWEFDGYSGGGLPCLRLRKENIPGEVPPLKFRGRHRDYIGKELVTQ